MKRIILLMILVGFAIGTAGCGLKNRVPRYHLDEEFNIVPFKRYSVHQEINYWHRFRRTAYDAVSNPLSTPLSEDMRSVLERHGQPSYVRENFESRTNELVDEWLFWDRKTTVQFIEGQLVYEGPLTDMDHYRVVYGYPDKAYSQQYEAGPRREIWDYLGLFDDQGMIVTFSDEKLVSQNYY